MARRKPKIKSRVELNVYKSLEVQQAYQMGMATALAGVADVMSQFAGYATKHGKLPDFCSEKEQSAYLKGLVIAFNGTAEVFHNFTDHIIGEGEKILKEKGWKGLTLKERGFNTEDDLK